jgi:2-polyprenyl-3-methyl-5-hydroxy-6-metoxy-1,4-benzoquinol methylase
VIGRSAELPGGGGAGSLARAPSCRLCGGGPIVWMGVLPPSDAFAGRTLESPLVGGMLWQCGVCKSMFRDPILSPQEYLALYSGPDTGEWGRVEGRVDREMAGAVIKALPVGQRILDVGCGAGYFLDGLCPGASLYGVEPSARAGEMAAEKGISILGRTLADVPADLHFDVILLIDVIEHVPNPTALLDTALMHLAAGGILLVSTGDPASLAWRKIFKARFWYSGFPEHISFPSKQFFTQWQQQRGLDLEAVYRVRYLRLTLARCLRSLCIQILFWVSPRLYNAVASRKSVRSPCPRPRRYVTPGAPGVFRDHQVVVMSRGREGRRGPRP